MQKRTYEWQRLRIGDSLIAEGDFSGSKSAISRSARMFRYYLGERRYFRTDVTEVGTKVTRTAKRKIDKSGAPVPDTPAHRKR